MNAMNQAKFDELPEDWHASGLPMTLGEKDAKWRFFEHVDCLVPDPVCNWIAGQSWDWFFTVTANHNLTLASARRTAMRIPARIQKAGCGKPSPSATDGRLIWVAEPHKHAEDGYHLHGLYKRPHPRFAGWTNKREFQFLLNVCRNSVGGTPWVNRAGVEGLWHRCRLEPYKGKSGAEYVSKYLTKSVVDWDVHQILHLEV